MLYFILLLVAAALAGVVAALISANSLWAWVSTGLSVLALVLLVIDWIRRRSRQTVSKALPVDEAALDDEPVPAEGTVEGNTQHTADADSSTVDSSTVDTEDPAGTDTEPTTDDGAEGPEHVAGENGCVGAQGDHAAVAIPEEQEESGTESSGAVTAPAPAEDERAVADTAPTVADDAASENSATERDSVVAVDSPETAGVPGEEPTDSADGRVVAGLKVDVLVVDEYPRYHVEQCDWLTGQETITIPVSEARELGFTPCGQCRPDATLLNNRRKRRKLFPSRK